MPRNLDIISPQSFIAFEEQISRDWERVCEKTYSGTLFALKEKTILFIWGVLTYWQSEDFDSDSHIGDQTSTLQNGTKSIEKSSLWAKFLELSIFLFSGMCKLKDPFNDFLQVPLWLLFSDTFSQLLILILYPHEKCLSSPCCSLFPMQSKHIISTHDFADFLRSRELSNCVHQLQCFLSWKHSHARTGFIFLIWLLATCVYWWGVIGVSPSK